MIQSELKRLLHYDPQTGVFTWVTPTAFRIKKGDVAGCLDATGYRIIRISGKAYKAHRLAYLYMEGELPKDQLDHINRMRDDNRWINLRDSSASMNAMNRTTSGKYNQEHSHDTPSTPDGV